MTTFNYTRMTSTALRLITRFGKAWTVRRYTKGTYDPSNNTRTTSATTDYTVQGMLSDYQQREIDGTNILKGDKLLLVAASGLAITPTITDLLVEGSTLYKIVNIEQIKPASTVLYYKLQLRQ